jgi:transposase-like protein
MPPAQEAKRAEIVQLYVDEGLSAPEIARRYGVTLQSITYHLDRAGVARRTPVESHPVRRTRSLKEPRPPRAEVAAEERYCQLVGCRNLLRRGQSRFCTPEHYALSRFEQPHQPNELQKRVLDHLHQRGLSVAAFIRESGFTSLPHWLESPSRVLTQPNLARVATALGIDVETALVAGGKTAEMLWAEQGDAAGAAIKKLFKERPNSKKAKRIMAGASRGGKAHLGRTWPEERRTRRKDARKEKVDAAALDGAQDAAVDALTSQARTTRGRLIRSYNLSLVQWGKRHASGERPTLKEQRAMAGKAGLKVGACIGKVIPVLNESLRKRGLPAIGGEQGDAERCLALRQWLKKQPPTTGERPRGFWRFAPETEEWRRGHARGCPTLRAALEGRSHEGVKTPPQGVPPNTIKA